MASGGKQQHRMVFDIRGRRKIAVKVVYAVLAVLMGLSLFLVVGPVNLGELFSSNGGGSGEAAKPFEEQAERLEVKLKKNPEDPELLQALTRAQVSAGNSMVTVEPNGEQVLQPEAIQRWREASDSWSRYLKAADEPSGGLAQLMVPSLIKLAEFSRTTQEAINNLDAAVGAQKLVAEQRPSLNSFSTLALYTYFTGDYAAAEKAKKEAEKFAKEKGEREQLDKQLKEAKERSVKFQQGVKETEKAQKAAAKENKGKAPQLEGGSSALGSALGGSSSLSE